MSQDDKTRVQLLRAEIQNKFGKNILYASDCQTLSEQILNATKRRLSSSTLKRFFGIIQSPFAPSKYTLDTLSIFLEFTDWQNFIDRFEKEKRASPNSDSWKILSETTSLITGASLNSLKKKLGLQLETFPLRNQIDKKFSAFLNAPEIATALIAPEGYGKSNIAAQLTEKYFTAPNALFPNDVACLVDGSILFNLLTHDKIINFLYNLIEYDPQKSFSATFRNNPELVKGRFVLIVDEVDEIYSETEKTIQFIDNLLKMISTYQNISWYKILITCTPEKWRMFIHQIQKNPLNKLFWYKVPFAGTNEDFINIPLLTNKEIELTLKKNHYKKDLTDLIFSQPDIIEIINEPYFFQLFLNNFKYDGMVSDLYLLDQYIKNKILSSPYNKEKFSIIKAFFRLCNYGLKSSEVNKEELGLRNTTAIAYEELTKSGILYEYTITDNYLTLNTYVKFSHNILFSYYLANLLVREHVNENNFLKTIIFTYRQSPALQCNLIKYIIKILFRDEKTEILRNIFDVMEETENMENDNFIEKPCTILPNVVRLEMRKNSKMRELLVPFYAKSSVGNKLYFEKFFDIDNLILQAADDLDYYLQYNQSDNAKQYACSLKFMKYFLTENQEQCKAEYNNSLALKSQVNTDHINTSDYFTPQIIYQSVYKKQLDNNIIREIYRVSEKLFQTGIQQSNEIPQFEFEIIISLRYGRMNKEIIELSQYIISKYNFTDLTNSCFYQLFLSIFALALLETGEQQKAIELYDQINFRNIHFPELMKNYFKIRLMLIQTRFLIYKGKLKKGQRLLEKVKTISLMLKFSYFYNSALELERDILILSQAS